MNGPKQRGGLLGDSGWFESTAFALIFCAYPVISFIPELLALEGRTVTIAFRAICIFLSAALFWANFQTLRQKQTAFFAILLFWGLYLWRIIHEYFYADSSPILGFNEYVAYAFGVSCSSMLGMFVINDWRRFRLAPLLCIVLCGSACVLAIRFGIEKILLDKVGRLSANARLNPIILGHTATTLITTSMWYLFRGKQHELSLVSEEKKLKASGLWDIVSAISSVVRVPIILGAIMLGLYVLALTASRGPSLALVTCLLCFIIWLRGRLVYLVVIGVAAIVVFIELGFVTNIFSLGIDIERLSIFNTGVDDDYGNGRGQLYAEAYSRFISSPLLGDALTLEGGIYPHNVILEAFMATGIVGGSILIWITYRASRTLVEVSRGSPLIFWLLLVMVQSLTGSMTSGAIYYDPMFWSTLGIGFGLRGRAKGQMLPRGMPGWAQGTIRGVFDTQHRLKMK